MKGSVILHSYVDVHSWCVWACLNLGPGSPLHKTGWSWSAIGYPAKYQFATESATCPTPPTTELLSKGPASVETTTCHGCKWVYCTLLLLLLCVHIFFLLLICNWLSQIIFWLKNVPHITFISLNFVRQKHGNCIDIWHQGVQVIYVRWNNIWIEVLKMGTYWFFYF